MRYKLILDESKHTQRAYWGRAIAETNEIADLAQFRPTIDQPWHVLDTKTGRKITQEEFWEINKKIMAKRYGFSLAEMS